HGAVPNPERSGGNHRAGDAFGAECVVRHADHSTERRLGRRRLVVGHWSLVIGRWSRRMTNDERPTTNDQRPDQRLTTNREIPWELHNGGLSKRWMIVESRCPSGPSLRWRGC